MANVKEYATFVYGMNNSSYMKGSNQINSVNGKMTKGFGIGKTAILGFTAAVAGAGAGIFKLADMASDLNESINVVTSVFGDSADEIISWSETSISAMGLSQTQALKTAGVYGAMGTSLGLTDKKALEFAMSLTQLSADLASFYNVSQDVAATSLKGIFTGETESLKQFGIMIDETTLKQYGYSREMSQSEKIMIRYKAVMAQTEAVQGDFARTSDGLANQSRILTEQFKQLGTVIGQKLIPVVTQIVSALNDGLSVAIALVSGDTANLNDQQLVLYATFQTVGNYVQTVFANAFAILARVMGIVGVIVKALLTTFVNLGTFLFNALLPILVPLGIAFYNLAKILVSALKPAIDVVVLYVQTLIATIAPLIEQISAQLSPIIAKLAKLFTSLVQAITPVVVAIGNLLIPIVQQLGSALSILISIFAPIIDFIVTVATPVLTALANVISTVVVVAVNLLTTAMNALQPLFDIVAGVARTLSTVLQTVLAVAFNILQGAVELVTAPLRAISNVMNQLGTISGKLATAITGKLKSAFDVILKPIQVVNSALSSLIGLLQSAIGGINSFFDSVQSKASSIPVIGGFFDSPTPQGAMSGTVNNFYSFQVSPQDSGSYRSAYRSGAAMVQSQGRTL